MFSEISSIKTAGVLVSVQTTYVSAQSSPQLDHFVFAYKVQIRNESDTTVQLLRRQWFITDGLGRVHTVEGEGVVGKKPVLSPGETHEYMSGCDFRTPIGQMHGYYFMVRPDGTEFKVRIPKFAMVVPFLLN